MSARPLGAGLDIVRVNLLDPIRDIDQGSRRPQRKLGLRSSALELGSRGSIQQQGLGFREPTGEIERHGDTLAPMGGAIAAHARAGRVEPTRFGVRISETTATPTGDERMFLVSHGRAAGAA